MKTVDGVFACDAGGMTFSQNLHDILSERFPVQKLRSSEAVVGRQLTRWFCPGCGVPLERGMVCRRCGQSISDLLWPLVELHPHADG